MSQQEESDYIKGFDKGIDKGTKEYKESIKMLIDAITDEVMESPPSPKDIRDYYYYRGQVSILDKLKEIIK
jgi:hypothetical protein